MIKLGELVRIWEETVVAYFKVLFWNSPEGIE
jgi:hypothetical protein